MDLISMRRKICVAYHDMCGHCPLYTPRCASDPDRSIIDMPRKTIRDVGCGSITKGDQINICSAIIRYNVRGQLPKKMIRAIEAIFIEYEDEINKGLSMEGII